MEFTMKQITNNLGVATLSLVNCRDRSRPFAGHRDLGEEQKSISVQI
jgi:hypothetical protein